MVNPKVRAYLGFCIKSGNLTVGFEAAERLKKRVYLLLLCSTASDNAKKQAAKLQRRFSCPLILCKGELLEDLVGKPHCKLAAVREKNLAEALLGVTDEAFGIISGGNE